MRIDIAADETAAMKEHDDRRFDCVGGFIITGAQRTRGADDLELFDAGEASGARGGHSQKRAQSATGLRQNRAFDRLHYAH